MSRYRLYTENKNLKFLIGLFDDKFESWNYAFITGSWKGVPEAAVAFEVVNDSPLCLDRLKGIAEEIKFHNDQETVMITMEQATEVYV